MDFLDRGESFTPDCLVLDIQMPEMTGIELRDLLKTRPRPIPIIFITAHDEDEHRKKAVSGGAVACLHKPFGDEELLAAIVEALGLEYKSVT